MQIEPLDHRAVPVTHTDAAEKYADAVEAYNAAKADRDVPSAVLAEMERYLKACDDAFHRDDFVGALVWAGATLQVYREQVAELPATV